MKYKCEKWIITDHHLWLHFAVSGRKMCRRQYLLIAVDCFEVTTALQWMSLLIIDNFKAPANSSIARRMSPINYFIKWRTCPKLQYFFLIRKTLILRRF